MTILLKRIGDFLEYDNNIIKFVLYLFGAVIILQFFKTYKFESLIQFLIILIIGGTLLKYFETDYHSFVDEEDGQIETIKDVIFRYYQIPNIEDDLLKKYDP